jgi:hypothetical protein
MTWKMINEDDAYNPAGGKMEKWVAYPENEDRQITVQPTWGRGRRKGKYEVLLWEENKGKSKILGYSNTFIEGIETAKKYIKNNKEHKKLVKL